MLDLPANLLNHEENRNSNPIKHQYISAMLHLHLRIILLTFLFFTSKTIYAENKNLVLAHYMVCCSAFKKIPSTEELKQEIILAKNYKLDGFSLNIGEWNNSTGPYKENTKKIYSALDDLDVSFCLIISLDGKAFNDYEEISKFVLEQKNNCTLNNKKIISSFSINGLSSSKINEIVSNLKKKNIIFLPHIFPTTGNPEKPNKKNFSELIENFSFIEGYFYFGAAGEGSDLAKSIEIISQQLKEKNMYYIAGVSPFYSGTGENNRFYDGYGFAGMQQQWEAAIRSKANIIEIVTWNDWMEKTYVMPYAEVTRNNTLWGNHFGYNIYSHKEYLSSSEYYINWYKNNNPPDIKKNKISFFYKGNTIGFCTKKQKSNSKFNDALYIHTEANEKIELKIFINKENHVLQITPGINNYEIITNENSPPYFYGISDSGKIYTGEGEVSINKGDECPINYYSGSIVSSPSK